VWGVVSWECRLGANRTELLTLGERGNERVRGRTRQRKRRVCKGGKRKCSKGPGGNKEPLQGVGWGVTQKAPTIDREIPNTGGKGAFYESVREKKNFSTTLKRAKGYTNT